jgi:hypothetical protein
MLPEAMGEERQIHFEKAHISFGQGKMIKTPGKGYYPLQGSVLLTIVWLKWRIMTCDLTM